MKPDLYIRFSIRNEDGRSGGVLILPLQGAWQEDSNDLHVAFAYKGAEQGGVWYRPAVDKRTGDYLLPAPEWADAEQIVRRKSPQTGAMTKCVLAYSIEWLGKLPPIYGKAWLESPAYIKQVEDFWYSPNI